MVDEYVVGSYEKSKPSKVKTAVQRKNYYAFELTKKAKVKRIYTFKILDYSA